MNSEPYIRSALASAVGTALTGVTCLTFEPVVTGDADVVALGLKDNAGKLRYAYVGNTALRIERLSANRAGLNKHTHTHEIRICRGVTVGAQDDSYDSVRADVASVLEALENQDDDTLFATVSNAIRRVGTFEAAYSLIRVDPLGVLHSGLITIQTQEALRRA